MKYCFLQISDNLLNPDDSTNPADMYFKAIWNHLDGEGYFKPEHCWEIPTWVAELSYCLNDGNNELELFHIDVISNDRRYPILPKADIYFASVMDCNKEILQTIVKNNPEKFFYLGGYIGYVDFLRTFKGLCNVSWYESIEHACSFQDIPYQYGTDYRLFRGMKCIPRLTLSNGCTNHCRFCTVPDEIVGSSVTDVEQQIQSLKDLDFELVYINDKTFGQCENYVDLRYIYNSIKKFNPKFRGFTIQTTCHQIIKFNNRRINLKDLYIINVELGIESFNNTILNKYNKPQNTSTIDLAIFILVKMEVNIIPNIIIGLPGETMTTYCNTLRWVKDNKHDFLMLNINNFVPYTGSDASDIVETAPADLDQTVSKRSYHSRQEAQAIMYFTTFLFDYGMQILKATKARSL